MPDNTPFTPEPIQQLKDVGAGIDALSSSSSTPSVRIPVLDIISCDSKELYTNRIRTLENQVKELTTALNDAADLLMPSPSVPITPQEEPIPALTSFDDKNLPKEKQKAIIATLKEEKAEFLLESYSSKDGIETWVWNDPDPAKKGNPDYNITYKRLPDGTLNISYGKLASAYLCFEPDESTGRHGTIVGIDNNSMKIHSPNQDNQIIVEKPQQTTWQDKVQNQRENQRITVSPPSQ